MGQHIVPRHLLRRISPDGKNIWQYDKKSAAMIPPLLPITRVSQTRQFFDDDIEKLLSTIEGAVNPILDKLTQGRPINVAEKRIAAIYLEMFSVRNRGMREELAGKFLDDSNKIKDFLDTLMEPMRGTDSYAEYESQKTDAIERIEAHPEIVFSSTWKPSNLIRLLLYRMTWCVFKSEIVDFVVSEPPMVLAGVGIGHPEAQIFFPLSSRHVLFISWLGAPSKIHRDTIAPNVARYINKIFVCKADRFVFFSKHCPKMAKLVKKKNFYDDQMGNKGRLIPGVNPYRPKQPWVVPDEDWDGFGMMICMHPAASNFKHAWHKAENHQVIYGGKVMKWCRYCGLMILKYENDAELIRNNEVALATGKFGPQRNWWMYL